MLKIQIILNANSTVTLSKNELYLIRKKKKEKKKQHVVQTIRSEPYMSLRPGTERLRFTALKSGFQKIEELTGRINSDSQFVLTMVN